MQASQVERDAGCALYLKAANVVTAADAVTALSLWENTNALTTDAVLKMSRFLPCLNLIINRCTY